MRYYAGMIDAPPRCLAHEHPIRLAHRGSRLLWPENTLYAFEQAVGLGITSIETDIRRSADGALVVFHDELLDRTTEASGRLGDRTLAELQALDLAYRFDAAGDHPLRGTGIGISTLEEVLLAMPEVTFNIDLKEAGLERPLATLIEQLGCHDRVCVASFDGARLNRFRRLTEGRVATSAGPGEVFRAWLGSRFGRPPRDGAAAYQVPTRWRMLEVVDQRFVDAAHRAGKQVHVWTIDAPEEMERLLNLGVDGIVSDRPDLLSEVVAARRAPETQ